MKNLTILFDLDGTLIDSTGPILEGFYEAFRAHQMPIPTDKQIKSLIGHPLDIMFLKLGADAAKIDSLLESYKLKYRALFMEGTSLIKGAKEAVELASENAVLGVVTTKNSTYSVGLLEHLGIMRYLSVIIGRNDVMRPKPDSEPILKALTALNRPKNGAFMIGDTQLDARAAKAAGIVSVGVSCGYEAGESLNNFCDFVAPDPLKAVQWIISGI